jgi:hypothetical protein
MIHLIVLMGVLAADSRNIREGAPIPTKTYADQPYVVKTDDGAWLVCITTGAGREGAAGQHVVTMRSTDQGKTWSGPVEVEPADGPEASYAVMLKAKSGRIYIFYNHNTDNLRSVKGDDPPYKDGLVKRVDSLGHFVFKYSDDHGKSWSARRYEIPQRDFEIDRKNVYGGKTKFFWNVGKAFAHRGAAYVPLHKVGGFGEGFFTSSEGVLLRSENLLTENDPSKIRWVTWPEGEIGLRTPPGGGTVAEEQSFAELSDGSLFAVYRTIDGHSVYSYSRDSGRSWETPQYMRFADGRLMKHPRAANFVWRCDNGKFLYWFHNHGGRFIREHPQQRTIAYNDRNPVWLSGGVEADGPNGKIIRWSQAEIALYDDDPMIRMSYPDLVEEKGRYWLTETQKNAARTHEIDPALLAGLWGEAPKAAINEGELPVFARRSNREDYSMEDLRAGATMQLRFRMPVWKEGETLLSNLDAEGKGFAIRTLGGGRLEFTMSDGRTENRSVSERVFRAGQAHDVSVIVDGGPKLILWVADGKLLDGGDEKQFGWSRYNPNFQSLRGAPLQSHEAVQRQRIVPRALRVFEAIGPF